MLNSFWQFFNQMGVCMRVADEEVAELGHKKIEELNAAQQKGGDIVSPTVLRELQGRQQETRRIASNPPTNEG